MRWSLPWGAHSWLGELGEDAQLILVLPGQLCCPHGGRELSFLFFPATKQEKNTPAESSQK